MKFELTGVDDALRRVGRIAAQVADRYLKDDALEALEPVVDDAKSLAPVGEGDLRDSIRATMLEDGTVAVIIGDWKGHFFELGTVKMRAVPMLVPAFDANEDLVIERFGTRIGARIEGTV